MRIIEHTVDIQAPAATVWQMVTDTDRYADWNPFMPRLSGRLTPGERPTLTVRRAPGGTGALIAGTRVSALADTWLAADHGWFTGTERTYCSTVRAQVTLEDHFHPEVIDPIIGEVLTEGDQVSWCSPP
jgi:uncharacterized protein YndB with AHSA1/START domain